MRQKRPREARSLHRKVHFPDGEVWEYRVGGSLALLRHPNGVLYRIPLPEITFMSYDDMDRGKRKQSWSGVRPQEIKNYIERHLRPGPEIAVPTTVFLHPMGSGYVWHIYKDCSFLPQIRSGQKFDAEALTPARARERLNALLTRRNLCGCCMSRSLWRPTLHNRQESEEII